MNIQRGFSEIAEFKVNRLRQYTHENLIVMKISTYNDMKLLGLILYKAINHLIVSYRQYLDVMPLSPRDIEIIETC